jgi:hypothetical protein
MTSANLPAAFNEQAIDRVAGWVAQVREQLNQFTPKWLEDVVRRHLREGNLTFAIKAREAAEQGDAFTDAALRHVGAELQLLLLQKQDLEPGHLQVLSYFQAAALRAPNRRKAGQWTMYDDLARKVGICVLVGLACAEFDLSPTRNRTARRAGGKPSGISVVTAALARNRIHLDEGTIQQKIWHGFAGELYRQVLAEHSIEAPYHRNS